MQKTVTLAVMSGKGGVGKTNITLNTALALTRLGERVVADIRKAVFARVIAMSPAFYERVLTGEIISRITTDTTLIQSVIGSSVSVALRNFLILIGGMVIAMYLPIFKLGAVV